MNEYGWGSVSLPICPLGPSTSIVICDVVSTQLLLKAVNCCTVYCVPTSPVVFPASPSVIPIAQPTVTVTVAVSVSPVPSFMV